MFSSFGLLSSKEHNRVSQVINLDAFPMILFSLETRGFDYFWDSSSCLSIAKFWFALSVGGSPSLNSGPHSGVQEEGRVVLPPHASSFLKPE